MAGVRAFDSVRWLADVGGCVLAAGKGVVVVVQVVLHERHGVVIDCVVVS